MKSAREHVVEIVDKFYNSNLDLKTIQNNYFNTNLHNSLDRNRIVVLSKEILRWKGRLDLIIKDHLNHPITKLQSQLLVLLELTTYELKFDEKVPNYAAINSAVDLAKKRFNKKTAGLVNAVMRKVSLDEINKKPTDKDYEWHSHPRWLFEKWTLQFGEERTHQLCEYNNSPVPLTIRRNSLNINHNKFLDRMVEDGIQLSLIENSSCFYNVDSGGTSLLNHQLFKAGCFSYQDRAAGAIVEVLDPKPNELILDVCCAPGTKTNYISELMKNTGKIYASDIDKVRVSIAKKDLDRTKNSNIIWEVKNAIKDSFPIADRILVDVPCTGTGVIGRRPDIKWRRKPKHLINIVELQRSILNNVCRFVKPGGILVYATCSLEEEENWQVVEAFLKLHIDFKVISIDNTELKQFKDEKGALKTFPPKDKMDGMFAVKMIRE